VDENMMMFKKCSQKMNQEKKVVNVIDTNPGINKQPFSVGENFKLKDSVFSIIGVGKTEMRLKLIPDFKHEIINRR
jgi:hypothetical protein